MEDPEHNRQSQGAGRRERQATPSLVLLRWSLGGEQGEPHSLACACETRRPTHTTRRHVAGKPPSGLTTARAGVGSATGSGSMTDGPCSASCAVLERGRKGVGSGCHRSAPRHVAGRASGCPATLALPGSSGHRSGWGTGRPCSASCAVLGFSRMLPETGSLQPRSTAIARTASCALQMSTQTHTLPE